ncbi:MAG TPA: hypothetical protein VL500_01085 [Candidatus Eisenbacteria bacterium]|nr:hypothetical protein [Candidatus Eisenbacteria bacterium]
MLKKSFSVIAGIGATVLLSWVCVRFGGPPRTPISTLGLLSLIGIIALVMFFLVTSVTYRADGTGGGTGALALLIATSGGTIIAFSLAASVLGPSTALLVAGATVIVALAAVAMISLSRGR